MEKDLMEVVIKGNPRRSEEEHVVKAFTTETSKRKRQEEESVLSDEIILHEILPWIPIKPLFSRFKLVCKEWCRVISTDSFFKTSQSQKCAKLPPPALVYYGIHKKYVCLPTTIDQDLVGMPDLWLKYVEMCKKSHKVFNHVCHRTLVASSNGLLCGSYYKERSEYFYVSNPITKQLVEIPNSNKLSDITLAFEPSATRPYYLLVGRSVINVQLDQNSNGNDITDVGFTVYYSNLDIWKTANAKVQIFRRSLGKTFLRTLCRSVFTSGKLYWKLEKDVLWFHIKEDTAGVVAVPDEKEIFSDGEIGEWNGELSYTKISSQNLEIWVLKSNQIFEDFKWVKKHCLSLMKIFEDNTEVILPYFHTVTKLKSKLSAGSNHRRALPYEGGNVVLFWLKKTQGKEEGIVFAYDMITGSLQLNHKSELKRWEGPLLSYKGSLVSVPESCQSML